MAKTHVVLMQAIFGDTFALAAKRLIETDAETASRMIRDGIARPLASHEPTDDQLSEVYVLEDVREGDTDTDTETNTTTTTTTRPTRNKQSRKKPEASQVVDNQSDEDPEDV